MNSSTSISKRIVGRGSEASVYYDDRLNRVEKRFDREGPQTAAMKAQRELVALKEAYRRTENHELVSVPLPLGLSDDGQSLYMEFIPGESLLACLMNRDHDLSEIHRLADLVAEGLLVLNPKGSILQPDCTLDHIIVRDSGKITFLDFGNGSESLKGIQHSDIRAVLSEMVGSTLYECARPGSSLPLSRISAIGSFLGRLAYQLGEEWNLAFEDAAWIRAQSRMQFGSWARRIFYRWKGPNTRQKLFKSARKRPLAQLSFVVGDFPSDLSTISNGIHKAVHGLLQGISQSAHHPKLKLLAVGPPAVCSTKFGYTVEYFSSTRALKQHLMSQDLGTLTVFNSLFSPFNTWLVFALCRRDLPFVFAPHMELSPQMFAKNWVRKWVYWHLFEKRVLRRAVGIHMLDSRQIDRLQQLGIHTTAFSAPNGISAAVLDREPKLSWSKDGPVRFHFFGRIEIKTKGLDLLLAAVSSISVDHCIEVYLQGPDNGDLAALKSEVENRKLASIVKFVEPDYQNSPIDLMAQYDVFLLPSRSEGFPVAAVEAMVAARPMVVTNVGGLSPIIRAHGLGIVVEPTAGGIEEGMRRVIDERPRWETMGLKAQSYATTHFRWSAIGQDVLENLRGAHLNG
ncbi:MAG: glycosyltransferase [Bacteroidetes bacterium]|nr:glycosyltransferase [Bacteroidota bacterium]